MKTQQNQRRILIAALDWGLGHATRLVPLIRKLKDEGCFILLASSGSAGEFLKNYFPELPYIDKPSYNINYSGRGSRVKGRGLSMAVAMLLQSPKILRVIRRERNWLKKIIPEYNLSEVISDNCYGLWNKGLHSVFITHQIFIRPPKNFKVISFLLDKINHYYINKFDECHVPDFEGEPNLSGELSHGEHIPGNVKFIGPLSRFAENGLIHQTEKYDIVVMLSGPEPQRTLLEEKCFELLSGSDLRCCLIRGLPGEISVKVNSENITWYNHLPDEKLVSILKTAGKVVCRSGYSTIMDLHQLKVKAMLIPTPGQTEQEYLAEHNFGKQFEKCDQENLNAAGLMKKEYHTIDNHPDIFHCVFSTIASVLMLLLW